MNFTYYMPTKLIFGRGSLKTLHKLNLPGKKAFIVMSNGQSAMKNGSYETLVAELEKANIEYVLYNKITPNPNLDGVMEGAKLLKENSCDFVIGFGGGSPIDASKSIAVMATNPGNYWDYIFGGSGKGQALVADPLPVVAITTTAGTGTEADPWTVVTKEDTAEKIGYGNDKTFPVLSIIDSELMRTVPKMLTAYQGFDALFHSTEGYIANCSDFMSDTYALKAIELIGKSLEKAVANGDDMDARDDVALANTLSGLVESTSSCTSEHALEHAMSAHFPELAHGAGLIMISLEYYKCFVELGVCDERFVDMAKALGKKDATKPMDFVDALADLQKACGVDELKMSDYGIKPEMFSNLVKNARETMGGLFKLDRYKLTDEMCTKIYANSYK